jgi:plastocyanin
VNAFHVIGSLFAVWAVTLGPARRHTGELPAGPAPDPRGWDGLGPARGFGDRVRHHHSALEEEEETGQPAAEERGGKALRLSADPGGELSFDRPSLEARAGPVTLVMDNPSSVPHNVSIEGRGVDEEGETVGQGGRSTVRAELRPGEYDFYCSVPGHREGGMEGTLTVR